MEVKESTCIFTFPIHCSVQPAVCVSMDKVVLKGQFIIFIFAVHCGFNCFVSVVDVHLRLNFMRN